MTEIVAADIGGTHARFAIARIEGARICELSGETILKTAEHASLPAAWEAFARALGRPLPRAAGIAVACPIAGDVLRLTNNPWVIRKSELAGSLGLDRFAVVNDFGAVANAVGVLGPEHFRHLFGPDRDLADARVVSVVGPGTGLGVALLARGAGGDLVIAAEGGHADFSPLDEVDEQILAYLRQRYRRVSIERVVSGPGLANIHAALAAMRGAPVVTEDDAGLWARALGGVDELASAAFERFCLSLGAAAGDVALTQGAEAVVIAGGLGLRIADCLRGSGFEGRFLAKGRMESRMAAMPVKLITHPQPGLFGAAVAFLKDMV